MAAHSAPPDFTAIYRAEFGYVWASLRRLGVREADSEDACHEVFVVVHRRLADYDSARPLRPWLFGIAYRVASEQRRRKQFSQMALDDTHAAPGDAPDTALVQKQRQQLVLLGLQAVPLEQRSVLILHDIDEVAAPDIAAALSIPLGTAYSRLRAGRRAFAEAVRQLRGSSDE